MRLLRRYLEIDTTNPPGNEAAGARLLAAILERHGIAARLLSSPSGRTSLYARLPATVAEPHAALVLSHHIDVVPAGDDWQVPPFSGRVLDGTIWGRGAVDVKSLGIAQLLALVRVAEDHAPRRRDLVYLAVADEETGGREGMGWLIAAHPELFDGVAAVLGEGGANRAIGERLVWWGIEVDQKRPLWLRLHAHGRGGHGAMPLLETATHTLIQGLARLTAERPALRVTPSARAFFAAVAGVEGGATARLYQRLDALLEAGGTSSLPPYWLGVLYDSLNVTKLQSSSGINIISPDAYAWIDSRLLPDTDQDAFLRKLLQRLGKGIEVEILLEAPPVAATPTDNEIYRTLARQLAVRAPTVPIMIAGITDNRYLRARNVPAYGWNPFILGGGAMSGVHGKNERIPRDAFLRGVELVVRVVRAMVQGDAGGG